MGTARRCGLPGAALLSVCLVAVLGLGCPTRSRPGNRRMPTPSVALQTLDADPRSRTCLATIAARRSPDGQETHSVLVVNAWGQLLLRYQTAGQVFGSVSWSSDSSCIAFSAGDRAAGSEVFVASPATGAVRELRYVASYVRYALTPVVHGSRLYLQSPDGLWASDMDRETAWKICGDATVGLRPEAALASDGSIFFWRCRPDRHGQPKSHLCSYDDGHGLRDYSLVSRAGGSIIFDEKRAIMAVTTPILEGRNTGSARVTLFNPSDGRTRCLNDIASDERVHWDRSGQRLLLERSSDEGDPGIIGALNVTTGEAQAFYCADGTLLRGHVPQWIDAPRGIAFLRDGRLYLYRFADRSITCLYDATVGP